MKKLKLLFLRSRFSLYLSAFAGLTLAACSQVETEPVSTDQTKLETDLGTNSLLNNPNLIHLEGEITESFGEVNAENERRRGAASDRARFNITLKYVVEPTERQREVFEAAAARWERIIIRDEVNFTGIDFPSAFPGNPPVVTASEVLDDVVIEVNLTEIDGPGAVLGRAGPRFFRVPQFTTLTGLMEFDVADLAGLDAVDLFEEVIIHEMGHVLGIGTFWRLADSGFAAPNLINLSTLDQIFFPDYLGRFGNLFWKTEGGEGLLPVEGVFFNPITGNPFVRPGTSFGHWDEDTLDNELMTGFLNLGVNPLSRITAGAVRDLGYGTATVGEPYDLPTQQNQANRVLRMDEDGINIAEREELLLPIGYVTARNR
ncbi:hypothetical protein [Algoriphagus namhaensis]